MHCVAVALYWNWIVSYCNCVILHRDCKVSYHSCIELNCIVSNLNGIIFNGNCLLSVPIQYDRNVCIRTYFSWRILLSSSSRTLPCRGRVSSLPRPRPLSPGLMTGGGSGRLRLFSWAMSSAAICSIFFTPPSTTTTPSPRLSTFSGVGVVSGATWEMVSTTGFFWREAFFLGAILWVLGLMPFLGFSLSLLQ